MIYFVDFDGTICPNSQIQPQKECIETLRELKRRNHTIVIYSCRSNPNVVEDANIATQEIIDYLKKYDIPYDNILWGKPLFNYIIDDRAVGVPLTDDYSVDWNQLQKIIDM